MPKRASPTYPNLVFRQNCLGRARNRFGCSHTHENIELSHATRSGVHDSTAPIGSKLAGQVQVKPLLGKGAEVVTLVDHPQTRWRTLLVTTLPSASKVGQVTGLNLPTSLHISPEYGRLQRAFSLSQVDRDGRAISSLGKFGSDIERTRPFD
jgi:hypothetical protein